MILIFWYLLFNLLIILIKIFLNIYVHTYVLQTWETKFFSTLSVYCNWHLYALPNNDKFCLIFYQKYFFTNYIRIIYVLSNFNNVLGVVSQTRVSDRNGTQDLHVNSLVHYPLYYQGTRAKNIFKLAKTNISNKDFCVTL